MCPKMSFGLLLRLAVLLAAFLAQSGEGATFREFQTRHMNYPQTRAPNLSAYCNLMMRQRGMMRGTCKPINTFIIARPNAVQNVCRRGGGTLVNRGRNLYNSRSRFRVVHCRSTGRYPNCNYRGRRHNRRIRVACRNNQPVHFDGYA